MSGLVGFDQKGAFGPAMTLIYNAQYYNEKGLLDLSNLLKANFTNLAHVKPKGKKEFCAFVLKKNQSQSPITPEDVISTRFFQNMQKKEPSPLYHEKVLGLIVPRMQKTIQEYIPHANSEPNQAEQMNEWTARFVESYMGEEQINKYCDLQSAEYEKIMEERMNIGREIYKLATTKELTEKDLDLLLDVSRIALELLQKADHFTSTLNLSSRFLTLFSMHENPAILGEEILSSLSTVFRQKMFPKDIGSCNEIYST